MQTLAAGTILSVPADLPRWCRTPSWRVVSTVTSWYWPTVNGAKYPDKVFGLDPSQVGVGQTSLLAPACWSDSDAQCAAGRHKEAHLGQLLPGSLQGKAWTEKLLHPRLSPTEDRHQAWHASYAWLALCCVPDNQPS